MESQPHHQQHFNQRRPNSISTKVGVANSNIINSNTANGNNSGSNNTTNSKEGRHRRSHSLDDHGKKSGANTNTYTNSGNPQIATKQVPSFDSNSTSAPFHLADRQLSFSEFPPMQACSVTSKQPLTVHSDPSQGTVRDSEMTMDPDTETNEKALPNLQSQTNVNQQTPQSDLAKKEKEAPVSSANIWKLGSSGKISGATFSQVLARSSVTPATSLTTTMTQTIPFVLPKNHHMLRRLNHNGYSISAISSQHVQHRPLKPLETSHVGTMTNVSMAEYFGNGTLNRNSNSECVSSSSVQLPLSYNEVVAKTIPSSSIQPVVLQIPSSIAAQSVVSAVPPPPPLCSPPTSSDEKLNHFAHLQKLHQQNMLKKASESAVVGTKKLSASAQPFVPSGNTAVLEHMMFGGLSRPVVPSYGSMPFYNQYHNSSYRGFRDDMEARKNHNNDLDYYYSEDEDLNDPVAAIKKRMPASSFQQTAVNQPVISPSQANSCAYSASTMCNEDFEELDIDGTDKMSIGSNDSVEFVMNNEGTTCLPGFLAAVADSVGRGSTRSLSASPGTLWVNQNSTSSTAMSNVRRIRSASVSVSTGMPPALVRGNLANIYQPPSFLNDQQQYDQQIFKWGLPSVLPPSVNQTLYQKPQMGQPMNSGGGSTLRSFLSGNGFVSPTATSASSAPVPTRIGRSVQRRHSNTTRHKQSQPLQRSTPLHHQSRRSLSISDGIKNIHRSSITPLKAIDGSILSALASMRISATTSAAESTARPAEPPTKATNVFSDLHQPPLSTSMFPISQLPQIPHTSRFEFYSKRYYMDLAFSDRQQMQLQSRNVAGAYRKTAQIRRTRAVVAAKIPQTRVPQSSLKVAEIGSIILENSVGSGGDEMGGQDLEALVLVRTASEPSLLSRGVTGHICVTADDCGISELAPAAYLVTNTTNTGGITSVSVEVGMGADGCDDLISNNSTAVSPQSGGGSFEHLSSRGSRDIEDNADNEDIDDGFDLNPEFLSNGIEEMHLDTNDFGMLKKAATVVTTPAVFVLESFEKSAKRRYSHLDVVRGGTA
ncbi:hypothetical protein HK100_006885 [Physocladia obscura]|uniref:Uncharacterized protein n=1 Tax=Physocladia obscura TaxID=109957 RepID=A0AAD5XIG1_9FUNG|nr:hypothetical protein HK100_006885 [Physocladia obscura]